MAKLRPKQQRFVDEYLIDLNATQAAIRAGYAPGSAQVHSSKMLLNAMVQNAISVAMAERSRRTGVNQDRIINELAKIAFINPIDVFNMNDATVADGANRDDTACISSLKVKVIPSEGGDIIERETKICDKLKALELLMRHMGMFEDKFSFEAAIPVVISGGDMLED